MGVLVRGLLVIAGIVVMLVGIATIAASADLRVTGLGLVAAGGILVVIVAAERQRYRSGEAERSNLPAGPGGGERRGDILEDRFQTTAEVFVDPTTGHQMRVLVDPKTGERRYVAEA
ncbi:MAG TPA: hypothetical protein VKR30_06795 [Candidatus Limnocylindrales bacterium]|nr:hypothetical protein [Candidatus Limnocylindrales bacterium]